MRPHELGVWFFRATMLCLLLAALTMSGGEAPHSFLNLFYWYLLPAAPFVLLAVLSFAIPHHLAALWGAALGAAVAVEVPLALLWYSSATYHGGGANIGLCGLWFLMPAYLPPCMLAGWLAALGVSRLRRHAIKVAP